MSQVSKLRNKLHKVLVRLYPTGQDLVRLCVTSGIRITFVVLTGKMMNDWASVLDEAEKSDKINSLITVVLGDYPDDPEVQDLIAM